MHIIKKDLSMFYSLLFVNNAGEKFCYQSLCGRALNVSQLNQLITQLNEQDSRQLPQLFIPGEAAERSCPWSGLAKPNAKLNAIIKGSYHKVMLESNTQ